MKAKMEVVRERTGKLICRYGLGRVLLGTASLKGAVAITARYSVVELIIGSDFYTLAKPHNRNHGKNTNALMNTVMELVRTHWGCG